MKNIIWILAGLLFLTNIATAQTYTYDSNHQLAQVKYDNGTIITIQYDANGNRISYAVSAGGALPLTLLNFNAQKSGGQALLTWSTSQEVNTDRFEIEHSVDGNNFSSFTTVAARGNSSTRSDYSTIHCCPVDGANYYRLRMIDKDGKFIYSQTRELTFTFASVMKVYPNPAPDKAILNISFTKAFTTDAVIIIYNSNGSAIYQSGLPRGQVVARVNMDRFAAGSYSVVVTGDGKKFKESFVKQ